MQMVQILLRLGATVDWQEKHGTTALMAAADNGHRAVVEALTLAARPPGCPAREVAGLMHRLELRIAPLLVDTQRVAPPAGTARQICGHSTCTHRAIIWKGSKCGQRGGQAKPGTFT